MCGGGTVPMTVASAGGAPPMAFVVAASAADASGQPVGVGCATVGAGPGGVAVGHVDVPRVSASTTTPRHIAATRKTALLTRDRPLNIDNAATTTSTIVH